MFEDESELYNLFISKLNEDNDEYDRFIGKLKASYDFQWEDHTIPDETDIENLKKQMKSVDVVVILSGLYSKDKNLIQLEIDIAVELKKPIVIIRPYGMENVPGSIEKVATEVVGWNAPCIIDAIRESAQSEDL
ncbi:MAG: TIR domain-containing protein [Methanobacterium sp.]